MESARSYWLLGAVWSRLGLQPPRAAHREVKTGHSTIRARWKLFRPAITRTQYSPAATDGGGTPRYTMPSRIRVTSTSPSESLERSRQAMIAPRHRRDVTEAR